MKKLSLLLAFSLASLIGRAAITPEHDYPVQPVPFTAVHFEDAFWSPRLETNRLTTIPTAFQKCEESHRMDNFARAAAVLRHEPVQNLNPPGNPFDDTDPYKVIEGASFTLAVQPDSGLEDYLNRLIALIGSAQEPDGYLYTTRTINPAHPHPWSGTERWVNDPQLSHELYDAGHLFEAAAAHYQATGQTNFLHIALREADLLCRTFGPATNQLHLAPGHEIVEMGLCRLYRVTGERRYLDLAKYFIDVRGPGGSAYSQADLHPVNQTIAEGHAVRAGYLYSGMADVAALAGDADYVHAIDAIWDNCVGRKLYITGGIGARHQGEAFGEDYELPNDTAYCETCAQVANIYWNQRLFLLHGDAKYVDVLERTLYNGLLSGVSLSGDQFFYPNPLSSAGGYRRSPWFGCACCPGNITRLMPSIPGYQYAQQRDTVFVNLYAGSTANLTLPGDRKVQLVQTTRYPWDGDISLSVNPAQRTRFTLAVRIPGWAREQVVPSDLYRFADTNTEPVTLSVNGDAVKLKLDHGYVRLARKWKTGDVVRLHLPLPVRRVLANEKVAADRGRVALERGPVVFCAEWPDNPSVRVLDLIIPDASPITAEFSPNLLGGVETLHAQVLGPDLKPQPLVAIPYYAWANRGPGEMNVWFHRQPTGPSTDTPALP